jgi:hypothetical protein
LGLLLGRVPHRGEDVAGDPREALLHDCQRMKPGGVLHVSSHGVEAALGRKDARAVRALQEALGAAASKFLMVQRSDGSLMIRRGRN